MDTQIMTSRWSRDELQQAHDNFVATANRCAEAGEWRDWADLFTEDATYIEHMFGEMHGREQIHSWIAATMAEWPNRAMTSFPHAWCSCDEEKGWWICRIENRFRDPGDGSVHQAHNLTVLHYAGDMRFSYEEDAYNPANFAPVVGAWLAAYKANDGTEE
jgi:SnoaL-like domain